MGNLRLWAAALPTPVRLGMVALLTLAVAFFLRSRLHPELRPRASLDLLPRQIDHWTARDDIDIDDIDFLKQIYPKPSDVIWRDYERQDISQPPIDLLILYAPDFARVQEMDGKPQSCCLPPSITQRQLVRIAQNNGPLITMNRLVVSSDGRDPVLALYWYQIHGRGVASRNWAKCYLLADTITKNRRDAALVRLTTRLQSGESPDAAQLRLLSFESQLMPMLDRYVPY